MPYRSLQDLVRAEHENKDQSGPALMPLLSFSTEKKGIKKAHYRGYSRRKLLPDLYSTRFVLNWKLTCSLSDGIFFC
jgi:hypothetical protein